MWNTESPYDLYDRCEVRALFKDAEMYQHYLYIYYISGTFYGNLDGVLQSNPIIQMLFFFIRLMHFIRHAITKAESNKILFSFNKRSSQMLNVFSR